VGTRRLNNGQRKNLFTRLLNIVNRQLPSALVKRRNPLFERQLKLLRWPPTYRMNSRFVPVSKMATLKEYTFRMGCFVPLLFAILVTAAIANDRYWGASLTYILLADLGFSLLCNVYYAITAINTIFPQIKDARWEPLRLTALSESDILMANYAIIQIRVWRVAVIEVAARMVIGLTTTLLLIHAMLRTPNYSTSYGIENIVFLVIVAIICVYALEPLWRMRAVTLIGMTMATWFHDYGVAVIVTFAAVLALLLAEIIVLVCSLWFDIAFGVSIFFRNYSYSNGLVELFIFALCTPLPIIGLYLLFKLVQYLVLARLERVAFRNI
jgi:hypothetical protein